MKIQDLLEELKKDYHTQEDCYEDFLEQFLNKYDCKKVKEGLEVDKHRWYETSIIVYKVATDEGDKFFGIRACTDIFGEESSYSDISWNPAYFEMIEKQEITYVACEEI